MPTGTTGLTLADLRKKKQPNKVETWIAGDPLAADRLRDAKETLARAERVAKLRPTDADAQSAHRSAKEAYDEVYAEVEPTLIHFVFQAIPIKHYDDLVGEHLWTDPQKRQWRKDHPEITDEQMESMPAWNPDTFPRALIAECCVEPKIDKDELAEWLSDGESWNAAEIGELFSKAIEVNNSRRIIDLGKG